MSDLEGRGGGPGARQLTGMAPTPSGSSSVRGSVVGHAPAPAQMAPDGRRRDRGTGGRACSPGVAPSGPPRLSPGGRRPHRRWLVSSRAAPARAPNRIRLALDQALRPNSQEPERPRLRLGSEWAARQFGPQKAQACQLQTTLTW
jgi:hypothetical protein